VPRNLRNMKLNLPKSKYEPTVQTQEEAPGIQRIKSAQGAYETRLQRNNSEPSRLGRAGGLVVKDNIASAQPHQQPVVARHRALAAIQEED